MSPPVSILRGEERSIADFTLLERFTSQARTAGDRVALIDDSGAMSYAELHRRSSQMAHALRGHGVSPGAFVGVALHRSNALVTALLAIVKTGGAFVPLDPDYPDARLERMIAVAAPRVILTEESFLPRFSACENSTALAVDDRFAAAESSEDLPVVAGPLDPLYVIFTSGSTGDPKGAVAHRLGFANLIEWYGREFSVDSSDRFLVISSPGFDLTQKNIFAPLQAGGTVMSFPSGPFDLTRLADLIARHRITAMNCTPSAFYPLVENPACLARLGSLRLAALGGEPISLSRVRRWLEESPEPRAEIANTYGPTECSDICGFHRMNRSGLEACQFVPLGRPLPNVQLAVVDDALRPVPVGEEGELLIGGVGVGLGYLRDPERTAERFVANPLSPQLEGSVCYRTGDRVRLLPEGELEFLGRTDYQVKLRGYRIELTEIELALAAHPAVREAVVVISRTSAEPVLAAFFTRREALSEDLRAFLAARLPEYMVPARIEELDSLPLTPNGKVDRVKLSGLHSGSMPSSATGTSSATEELLLSLWRAALGHDAIGLDDNFFDLGGDSIGLATVHARIISATGRPLPITDLFAFPTIRSLAAHLAGGGDNPGTTSVRDRALRQRRAFAAHRPTRA